MSAVPEEISERMRLVLEASVENVVSGSSELVKRHVWRNPDYVGIKDNRVVVWQGWSANLSKLDSRYRSLYIDYVENSLTHEQNKQLFGEVFASAVEKIHPFIFLFVTSCPFVKYQDVLSAGFTFRQINHVIHPGKVSDERAFLEPPLELLASRGAKLLYLQHQLRN